MQDLLRARLADDGIQCQLQPSISTMQHIPGLRLSFIRYTISTGRYQQTCSKEAIRALHLDIHQQIEWFCKEGLRRRFFDSFLSPIPLWWAVLY